MHKVDDTADTIGEYHARQRASIAVNEAAGTERALSATRSKVRSVRKHLENALELLDEGAGRAIRQEIEAAVAELDRMGVSR